MANVPVLQVSGEKLRDIRERELLLTRRAMGETLGRSAESVKRYERPGTNAVPGEYVIALARHLGIPLSRLRLRLGPEVGEVANDDLPAGPTLDVNDLSENLELSTFHDVSDIPLFDLPLAAGPWSEIPGSFRDAVIEGSLPRRFRVRLIGDSMEPVYPDRQIVEFEWPAATEIGRDYYVQLRDGTATFKCLHQVARGGIVLMALNTRKYPDKIRVGADAIGSVALAVGKYEPVLHRR